MFIHIHPPLWCFPNLSQGPKMHPYECICVVDVQFVFLCTRILSFIMNILQKTLNCIISSYFV